jgi:hypothetical protein
MKKVTNIFEVLLNKTIKISSVLFLTLGMFGLKAQTLQDNDGNVYKTITIGKQVWMAENLKTTKYNDGTSIPLVADSISWKAIKTPAYCWYNNDIRNKGDYGALYNWYTVNTNKLCPKGWHVPVNKEWTPLTPLPCGYRNVDGTFYYIKDYSYWWIANESSATTAYFRSVFWDGSDVSRDYSIKKNGFSVRCVMNKN